ncbi:Hypothetical predicted protein [Podarcis lilfordi]|uniref:Uncharacterized protein n=1 Tax=Podarcis lilfordi TaxID=74358 RepID=A0AA35NYI9_9SAUR|nr:Hypothetical predicted protein [Podarcis lilfordi]
MDIDPTTYLRLFEAEVKQRLKGSQPISCKVYFCLCLPGGARGHNPPPAKSQVTPQNLALGCNSRPVRKGSAEVGALKEQSGCKRHLHTALLNQGLVQHAV